MLVAALGADAEQRSTFCSRLRVMFYAAAALPQHIWQAPIDLSIRATGK
jgi:feruloyl-CoA synthase